MARCTSLSDGLPWRTAFLQTPLCSVYTHVCQVCVPCEKWASHSFHLFTPKSLLFRLKPRHTDLLHTTAGPGSFQSAAHFSPHFLYIIHAIKHIKFSTCRCAAPCFNDTAIWVQLPFLSKQVSQDGSKRTASCEDTSNVKHRF